MHPMLCGSPSYLQNSQFNESMNWVYTFICSLLKWMFMWSVYLKTPVAGLQMIQMTKCLTWFRWLNLLSWLKWFRWLKWHRWLNWLRWQKNSHYSDEDKNTQIIQSTQMTRITQMTRDCSNDLNDLNDQISWTFLLKHSKVAHIEPLLLCCGVSIQRYWWYLLKRVEKSQFRQTVKHGNTVKPFWNL